MAGLGGMAGVLGTRIGTNAADCADMRNNTTISGEISGAISGVCAMASMSRGRQSFLFLFRLEWGKKEIFKKNSSIIENILEGANKRLRNGQSHIYGDG
jgi:hypothetical protein